MKSLRKWTYFFTLLVIGFTPLDAIEVSEGSGITFGRYFFILMTISAFFSKDLVINKTPRFLKVLVLFTIWAFLTTIWSVNMDVTLIRVMYLIQYLIIVMVMLNTLNNSQRLKGALTAWILGTLFIAYKSITDFSSQVANLNVLYRVNEFGNPNENSFMMCYALLFCYLIDKSKYRIFSLAMSIISTFAIAVNASRMGVIMLVILLLSYCFGLLNSKKKYYLIFLLPLLILGLNYIIDILPKATLSRISGISDNIGAGKFSEREVIWNYALQAMSDHPIFYCIGCGWGCFAEVVRSYLGDNRGAHNFYLDVFFTTGFVGISVLITYFVSLFKIIKQTFKANLLNYMMLVIPLVSMMSTNWQSRRWWFLMGAFIYLIYKTRNLTEPAKIQKHGR